MRTSFTRIALCCLAASLLGPLPRLARADTFSMAAGKQTLVGANCYSYGVFVNSAGASKDTDGSCFNQQFVMPLYWRNFFSSGTNRSVVVRGRVPTTNSLMGCTLSVFSSQGALLAQDTESFATTNPQTYSTVTLTVNQVSISSTSFIVCSSIGPDPSLPDQSPNLLLKVDFTP